MGLQSMKLSAGWTSPEPDRVLRLSDGRRLQYREIGAADGRPVLALHGTPASRLMYAVADSDAARLGLRLIAPDRWGYAGSDPHPRPSLHNWAADCVALADHLGLPRFSVIGISGGGPYATGVAALFPDRIDALALAVPVGPIADTGAARDLGLLHRLEFRWAGLHPTVVRTAFGMFRSQLHRSPRRAISLVGLATSKCDRLLLSIPEIGDYLSTIFRDGLKPGAEGAVIDMQIFTQPWKVPLDAISAPTRIWVGGRDRIAPAAAVRELGRQIPGAETIEFEDAGHFWIVRDYPLVLQWLAGKGTATR